MKNTLVIVDDHSIIRSGLKNYLESESKWKVIKMASNSKELLEFLEGCTAEELPEIIIFDIQLVDEMSFSTIRTVSEKYPSVKPVAFSMFDTTGFILAARDNGAKGYISKTKSEQELLNCLEKVGAGEEYFPLDQEKEKKLSKAEQHMEQLTKQQRRVYQEILMGKTNEEIAQSMDLKLHSVEIYITRIYEKLGIFSREDILEVR
jgi:DNA-binding NarL/FixJ family response regulator